MKKYLLTLLFSVTFASNSQALMLETSILQGVVKSFDANEVVIVDGQGATHQVKRSEIPDASKLKQGQEISVHRKVDPKMFKFSNLPYKLDKINKMPISALRQIHRAYAIFLINIDNQLKVDGTMDKNQKDEKNRFTQIFQCLIDSAMATEEEAAAAANFNCFYAGWPTPKNSANQCRPPWDQSVMDAQTGANASFQYTRCGPDGTFRCNPVLFGPGTQHTATTGIGSPAAPYPGAPASVRVRATTNPEKGVCVQATTSTVVQSCLAATARDLGRNIERIKANPADFNRFATSVESFCRQTSSRTNPACIHLGDRLASIQFGLRAKATGRTVAVGTACSATSSGLFAETMNGAADVACPGRTCFVKASCPTTGGEPLDITSVCSCSKLMGPTGTTLPSPQETGAGLIVDCINDESIAVINPAPTAPTNINNTTISH
ncbi:MAG: hypothetical protein A2X86_16390 [Bdellovibrionales bacterium GWA2_49_15]|nr:MAG: hypothetical protein A2X86_16390 [Bdellovibrionales bacterium GWA2_49_15]HAZ13684.1 hypothetical protein [Bdellovibrionales bacterium]